MTKLIEGKGRIPAAVGESTFVSHVWREGCQFLASERGRRWLLASIVGLGFVLRLLAVLEWNGFRPDSPDRLVGDEPGYDNLARELLAGYGFTWPGRVPLYPLWLAAVYTLTRGSYADTLYVQIIPGLITIVLTYALGRCVLGPTAGLLAAFMAALSYTLIHQSLHLLSEVLYTPLVLLLTLTLWHALQKPSLKRFAVAGFVVGLSNLARPTLLLFPLFAGLLLWFVFTRRQALKYWFVYVTVAILTVSPWLMHNYLRYNAWFPLQTSNAILWQGSPEYYNLIHSQGYTYERIWSEVLYGPGWEAHDPNSVTGDHYWTRRALASIADEPATYLRFAGQKVFTYWLGDPNADWGNTYFFSYQALRRIGFLPWDAVQVMVMRALPILALGAAIILRRRWRNLLPIYVLLAFVTLLHAATHAEARLSEPFQPYLLIMIGGAVDHVGTRLSQMSR